MPLYGKALNRILSGVLAPVLMPFGGESVLPGPFALEMVVLRWRSVVSAEGGGGREEREGILGRTLDRQRKHSPVP